MQRSDLTPAVDLLSQLGTGATRARRPVYVDLLPPCSAACPAGENVQAWLADAQAGRYREAWSKLVEANPFPAVCGRVCFHPCESRCNRERLDGAVGIAAVERFVGDAALDAGAPFAPGPATGKRILVVGAGPCGLSAAYHLSRIGHAVEIRDGAALAGGMLAFGIPAYRLPRAELEREIARIVAMGVRIVTGHTVNDVIAEKNEGAFDAVLVAVGAQIDRRIDIPSRDARRVLAALPVLRGIEAGNPPRLGRRVVIYGGGDAAMDVARSARRLGADEPLIVYHRDRSHMKAHDAEYRAALAEGVKMRWLAGISSVEDGNVVVEELRLDGEGVPHPTGSTERLAADTVVLALGERADTSFLHGIEGLDLAADGSVAVDQNFMTGCPGIFAGGDATPGERSVTIAVGHGKRAASGIDRWLRGETAAASEKSPQVTFEMLHLPIYSEIRATPQATRSIAQRVRGFSEVTYGLDEPDARLEAQRCLSCGNCFECDQCYAACPQSAIVKLGPGERYRYDYERCTGCAVCFDACPCHAIEMAPEPVGAA